MMVQQPSSPFTPRELEIISHLMDGAINKTIAHRLGIGDGTVKVHITNILKKLGGGNRAIAALWGSQNGLIRASQKSTS